MVIVFVREHSRRPGSRIFIVIRFVFHSDYVGNLVDNLEYVGSRVVNIVPSRSFTVVSLFIMSLDGVLVFLSGVVNYDFEMTLGTGRFVLIAVQTILQWIIFTIGDSSRTLSIPNSTCSSDIPADSPFDTPTVR